MNNISWKDACHNAVSAACNLPLIFGTHYADMQHKSGPCRLVGAVIEANAEYDEESLPVYVVELEDGSRIDALEEELTSLDTDGLGHLIAGVSMTFGLSRILGDWAGPAHLMEEADESIKARFLALLAAPVADRAKALG
jgi:hypothetical protein